MTASSANSRGQNGLAHGLSLLAILVSVASIAFTVWQARLSVLPMLDWRIETDEFGAVGLNLVSVGAGPAIVTRVDVYLDGQPVGPIGRATCAKLNERLDRTGDTWISSCFSLGEHKTDRVSLKSNDQLALYFSCPRGPDNVCAKTRTEEFDPDRLRLSAVYQSVYRDLHRLD